MLQLLSQASGFTLGFLVLFAVCLTGLMGAIADAILKDLGLGAVVNGMTAMSGVVLGVWLQMSFFPKL